MHAYVQRDLKPQMHIIWLYNATYGLCRQACQDISRNVNLPNINETGIDDPECGFPDLENILHLHLGSRRWYPVLQTASCASLGYQSSFSCQ